MAKKKRAVLIVILALVLALAALCLRYTRPVTLADILDEDVLSVSCTLMDPYITTEGGTDYYHHRITNLDAKAGSEAMSALLSAMAEIPCRASFSGLLPHTVQVYSTGQGNLSITLYSQSSHTDLYLFSDSITVETIGDKQSTYNVDDTAFESLAAIVEAYGVQRAE